MIVNTLKEFLEKRQITPYRLMRDTALTNGVVYRLMNDKAATPSNDSMDAICRTYKVQPGELLRYEDD